jgi:predicted glycoside hydrolase/deacetylase ChbG (UPF0249 family)
LSGSRLLVVNADDFGFTRDVNDGIIESHRNGIVTSTSLMATGAAFDHAVGLALQIPTLDVGCHLTLVEGHSLLPPHRALPSSPHVLAAAIALGRIRVYDECAVQVRKILDAGLRVSHLDTHKHMHLLPAVAAAVVRISQEFRIPWVRRPLPGPVFGPALGMFLARRGCRMTDRFAGFRLTGKLDTPALVAFIRRLGAGTTELMCHPGYLGEDLSAARTRLKQSREREVEALTSPLTQQAVQEAGVRLVSFRDLTRMVL